MACGPAPRPRPGPRLPGCPRAARPRAAWQFASSSSSSLRPWPPPRPRSPSPSTASCPRKRPGPPPSSVATRSMTGGGCSSPSWTRGSTRGLRACRCASRRGPGRGRRGGGAAGRPGTRRGHSLGAPQAESRSAAERERAPGGGGGQGGRGARVGPSSRPRQKRRAWRGWPGRLGPPFAQESASCPGVARPGPWGPFPPRRLPPQVPHVSGTGPCLLFSNGDFTIFIIGGDGGGEETEKG